jgi:UDP-3-O-[3-hydroxymyristoyl] N-acetylglucosamine deacetylase
MNLTFVKKGYQKTIKNPIHFDGFGVHKGEKASITIMPAPAFHGIQFVRTDLKNVPPISALAENVSSTFLSTRLEQYGYSIDTIEHLMAALYVSGVDNALIYVHGNEIPIMDGSSKHFFEGVEDTGIITQMQPKFVLKINQTFSFMDENKIKRATIVPHSEFKLKIDIDFKNKYIGKDSFQLDKINKQTFKNIVGARTFGFEEDALVLKKMGRGLGASLDNTLIFNNDGLHPDQEFRMEKEHVKHKFLDAVGDLSLIGLNVIGSFDIYKPGHTINHLISREIRTHLMKLNNTKEFKLIKENKKLLKKCLTY